MASIVTTRAPGPRGSFLLGCLPEFRRDPIALLLRSALTYGDVVRLKIGPVLAHLINHPEHIEHVLVRKSRNYTKNTRSVAKIRATCGASLLSADGEAWRRHRRLVQPAFQPESMEPFARVIVEEAARMIERWSDASQAGRPLNGVSEMMRLTFLISARCLFGAEIADDAETVERSLAVVLDDTWRRLESWIDLSTVSAAFQRRAFREAIRALDGIVYRIVELRRRQGAGRTDLLSRLMAAHDEASDGALSAEELRDAVVTLLLAGHETTANALAWTLHLVSESAEVQNSLAREAQAVLADGSATHGAFETLAYTGQVFAEAIRLYPSIWLLERRVVENDRIGGFPIRAGSTILISPYVLHRHRRYWPAAESFDPERFSTAALAERPKLAYLPFGAGPHQCVGRPMALLVGRLVLAMIFQRFRLAPVSGRPIVAIPGITLRPGGPLEFTLRNKMS